MNKIAHDGYSANLASTACTLLFLDLCTLTPFTFPTVAFGACTSYYSGGSYEGYCPATTPVIRAHTFALAHEESRVFNFTINIGSQSCSFLIELPK